MASLGSHPASVSTGLVEIMLLCDIELLQSRDNIVVKFYKRA